MQARFKALLRETFPDVPVDDALVDAFVKNAHHIKLLRGRPFGAFDRDAAALGAPSLFSVPFLR